MLFKRNFFKQKPKNASEQNRPDYSDLGFDDSFSEAHQNRFLNKDGSFNVLKKGLTFFQSLHLYHSLLTMSWPRFYATVFSTFVFINILFACLFALCGSDAIYITHQPSTTASIVDLFFFSVHSFTTVGYGNMHPVTFASNSVAATSSFVGLLSFALATGIFFARFSRPVTKVQFSEHALISPFKDSKALLFRLVNTRAESELIQVKIKVVMTWFDKSKTETQRKFKTLKLVRTQVTFMPAVWTVIHPIDPESPLHNKTKKDLEESDAEFLITLSAFDETFSQTVYKRSSYKWFELNWGANFTSMITGTHNGLLEVDITKLNTWEHV